MNKILQLGIDMNNELNIR